MSRTYRRRGAALPWYVLSSWKLVSDVDGRYHFEHVDLDRHSAEGAKAVARFHGDRRQWNTPPRDFRRFYHHADRQACRQGLQRWLTGPEHDHLAPPPHRHSAAWDWS